MSSTCASVNVTSVRTPFFPAARCCLSFFNAYSVCSLEKLRLSGPPSVETFVKSN